MSFAFPAIDPNTRGSVNTVSVPLSRYLDVSFDTGQHYSILNAMSRMSEMSAADADQDSPILDVKTLNERYAIGNLKFEEPTRESVARVMAQRQKNELDRNFFLSQGTTAMRFIPGLAASMIGSVSNPLDLGIMFVPFVGEEAVAAKATGVLGRVLARRLITRETLKEVFPRAPRLAESVINGTLGQSLFEVPNVLAAKQDKTSYGIELALFNVAAGGALAASIHGAGVLLQKLGRGTREQMARDAINQFLRDENIRVHKYVKIDENLIWEKIKFDEAKVRSSAPVDLKAVESKVFDMFGTKLHPEEPAAWVAPDGSSMVGPVHFTEKMVEFESSHPGSLRAYQTVEGKLVMESKLAEELGVPETDLTTEYLTLGTRNSLTDAEEGHMFARMEDGLSEQDALREIFKMREDRARAKFLTNPDNQALVKREFDRQVEEFVAQERAAFEEQKQKKFDKLKQEEIERQISEGKMLPDEEVQRRAPAEKFEDVDEVVLDDDIATLQKQLEAEFENARAEAATPKQSMFGDTEAEAQEALRRERLFSKRDPNWMDQSIPKVEAIDFAIQCLIEKSL